MKTLTKEEYTDLQLEQIVKHYYSEHPLSFRKKLLLQVLSKTKTIDEFHAQIVKSKEEIKQIKDRDTPILLESIIFNSLGYERNEALEKTCYKDYKDKNIHKFAKPFINGQYKIFRNQYDDLLTEEMTNTSEVSERLENVIKLLVKHSVLGILDFEKYLLAIEENPKAIDGIVKKILK